MGPVVERRLKGDRIVVSEDERAGKGSRLVVVARKGDRLAPASKPVDDPVQVARTQPPKEAAVAARQPAEAAVAAHKPVEAPPGPPLSLAPPLEVAQVDQPPAAAEKPEPSQPAQQPAAAPSKPAGFALASIGEPKTVNPKQPVQAAHAVAAPTRPAEKVVGAEAFEKTNIQSRGELRLRVGRGEPAVARRAPVLQRRSDGTAARRDGAVGAGRRADARRPRDRRQPGRQAQFR